MNGIGGPDLALELRGPHDLRLGTREVPAPGPGEAIVDVRAVGICGSDLHWLATGGIGDVTLSRPLVLGHEGSGVITTGARAGQRVAIDPSIPCQTCEPCRLGRRHLCVSQRFAGYDDTGGLLQTRLAWPEAQLVPLPDTIDDLQAAMLEPLGVALHAIDLAQLRVGGSVAVVGCGPIGLLIVAGTRLAGCGQVLAIEPLAHRLEAARAFGADLAVESSPGGTARLLEATGGRGVDVAFEVAGESAALDAAIEVVRPAGTVVVVGIPADDRYVFTASVARRKGIDLRLSRRMGRVYGRAVDLVASGRLDPGRLVTHRHSLGEAVTAFGAAARREGIKVVIEPQAGRPEEVV